MAHVQTTTAVFVLLFGLILAADPPRPPPPPPGGRPPAPGGHGNPPTPPARPGGATPPPLKTTTSAGFPTEIQQWCNCTYSDSGNGTKFCNTENMCNSVGVANRHLQALRLAAAAVRIMHRRKNVEPGAGEEFDNVKKICDDFRKTPLDYIHNDMQKNLEPACISTGQEGKDGFQVACGMAPKTEKVGLITKQDLNNRINQFYEYMKCDPKLKPALYTDDVKYCKSGNFCNPKIVIKEKAKSANTLNSMSCLTSAVLLALVAFLR